MNRKNIGFREFRNVGFIKQVYGANIRNMAIVAAIAFLLWVELLVSFIRTQDDVLFFIVFTALLFAFCGALLYFVAKPYSHPVYRQIAKYFGKTPEDIERGVSEISMSFVDQNLTFSLNKNYFSDTWFIRRNFLFSDICPLATPEELEEIRAEKEKRKQLHKQRKQCGIPDAANKENKTR